VPLAAFRSGRILGLNRYNELFECSMDRNRNIESSRRAFTLIELLVVIGVIGILAGLILPALARAKERAWVTRCLVNQKQIGAAVMLYAEDNEHYPPGRIIGVTQWDLTLGQYVGAKDDPSSLDARTLLYMCPSAKVPNLGIRLNYSANPNVFKEIIPGVGPVRADSIKRTADVIMVADAIQYEPDGNSHAILWGVDGSGGAPIYWNNGASANSGSPIPVGPDRDQPSPPVDGNKDGSNFRYRHAGASANASFADGHAERIKKGKVLDRNLYTNY
jgi:prepilin-type N-terminal cleavage/methylation domain-containing protein/prepilin-type processing-associated H-X9-DG protein